MNDEAAYRTAPATPGLLIKLLNVKYILSFTVRGILIVHASLWDKKKTKLLLLVEKNIQQI